MNKLTTIAILFFFFLNDVNSQTVVNLKKNKSEKIITKSGKNKYIDENGNIYYKKKKRKKKNRVVVKKPIRKKAKINVKRIHQIENQVKHDVIAFLTSITEKAGITTDE